MACSPVQEQQAKQVIPCQRWGLARRRGRSGPAQRSRQVQPTKPGAARCRTYTPCTLQPLKLQTVTIQLTHHCTAAANCRYRRVDTYRRIEMQRPARRAGRHPEAPSWAAGGGQEQQQHRGAAQELHSTQVGQGRAGLGWATDAI